MPVTISADDPRSIRAIEIAANAAQWRVSRTPEGELAYRVPSQSRRDRSYLVTSSSCDCPDFVHGVPPGQQRTERVCKHVLAVRLHEELVRAVSSEPRALVRDGTPERRRRHLTLVSRRD